MLPVFLRIENFVLSDLKMCKYFLTKLSANNSSFELFLEHRYLLILDLTLEIHKFLRLQKLLKFLIPRSFRETSSPWASTGGCPGFSTSLPNPILPNPNGIRQTGTKSRAALLTGRGITLY